MRYVKLSGDEPGFKFDLLRGKRVYSSRFLSSEEHMLTGRIGELWAALWCVLLATPSFLRQQCLPALHWYLVGCGIGANIILLALYLTK